MKNEMVKSIVILFVICLVISAALAIVNSFTAPVIAVNSETRESLARQSVMSDAVSFEPMPEAAAGKVTGVFKGLDANGETVGYVFTASGAGFGGNITIMCGIGMDGKITACSTLDVTSETSTLGGLTAKEPYYSQYAGQDSSLAGVDAISGATITSNAYKGCVEAAFEVFDSIKEAA